MWLLSNLCAKYAPYLCITGINSYLINSDLACMHDREPPYGCQSLFAQPRCKQKIKR